MRAILFDFGGTIDFPRHWLDRFLTHYREAAVILTRDELDQAFDTATQTAYRAASSIRGYGLSEVVRYLVGLQLEDLSRNGTGRVKAAVNEAAGGSLDELADRISRGFVRESMGGMAESREVLAALKQRFRIGIVSNFYGNLDRVLAEAGLSEMVDTIADSSRLGIFKPDPGIYRAALAALDVQPGEAAMVGDSLDKDCAPAKRLGLTTVWLRHADVAHSKDVAGVADFTIEGLAELKTLKWAV
jgi:putative hydrolase of the HAD superfamily